MGVDGEFADGCRLIDKEYMDRGEDNTYVYVA